MDNQWLLLFGMTWLHIIVGISIMWVVWLGMVCALRWVVSIRDQADEKLRRKIEDIEREQFDKLYENMRYGE